jgi:hypothetical protein
MPRRARGTSILFSIMHANRTRSKVRPARARGGSLAPGTGGAAAAIGERGHGQAPAGRCGCGRVTGRGARGDGVNRECGGAVALRAGLAHRPGGKRPPGASRREGLDTAGKRGEGRPPDPARDGARTPGEPTGRTRSRRVVGRESFPNGTRPAMTHRRAAARANNTGNVAIGLGERATWARTAHSPGTSPITGRGEEGRGRPPRACAVALSLPIARRPGRFGRGATDRHGGVGPQQPEHGNGPACARGRHSARTENLEKN